MSVLRDKDYESRRAELQSVKTRLVHLRLSFASLRFYRLALKAGFDPDQPRHPKGQPDAGQWREGGSPKTPSREPRLTRGPKTPPKMDRLRPPAGIGHNRPPCTSVPEIPLEPPPPMPLDKPDVPANRTAIAKAVAKWILRAVAKRALGPVSLFLDFLDLVDWIRDYYPEIQSYFDEPMTLEELNSYAADGSKAGYEIHHIVERTSAAKNGFPLSMIDGYGNLVRVPTYMHHEITAWYAEPNVDFGGQTPRQFLADKPWEVRDQVGLYALRKFGVLVK